MSNPFDQAKGLTFADLAPKKEPDNEAIANLFDDDRQIRTKCPVCREDLEGSKTELSEHIEGCNGPG